MLLEHVTSSHLIIQKSDTAANLYQPLLNESRKKQQNPTNGLISTFDNGFGNLRLVAFSPDDMAAGGSIDTSIKLWNTADRTLLPPVEFWHTVNSVAFSPDGKTLATGTWHNTIQLWNVADGKLLSTFKGHSAAVQSLAFSRDGKTLVSGSQDATIRFWQVP